MSTILRVGDRVLWSGVWGEQATRPVHVVRIDLIESGQIQGVPVDAVPWSTVPHEVVVDLDNGHWAYGHQLRPMPDSPEADCMLDNRGTCVVHHVVHEYVNDADETGAAPHF